MQPKRPRRKLDNGGSSSDESEQELEQRKIESISAGLQTGAEGDCYNSIWAVSRSGDAPERMRSRFDPEVGLFDHIGVSPHVRNRVVSNIVFNVPVSYFENPNEPRFGQWQLLDERSKALYDLFTTLIYLSSNPQYCVAEESNEKLLKHVRAGRPLCEFSGAELYGPNDIPNVVFHCERIYTNSKPRTLQALRMWFHTMVPTFSFAAGLERLIVEIDQQHRKQMSSWRSSSQRVGATITGGLRTREGWRAINSRNRWIGICNAYLKKTDCVDSSQHIDRAHATEIKLTGYNPVLIFTVENAMTIDLNAATRPDQCARQNYALGGQNIAFPHSRFVFHIPAPFVKLQTMMSLPVPGNHGDDYAAQRAEDEMINIAGDPMDADDAAAAAVPDNRQQADPAKLAKIEEMLRTMSLTRERAGDTSRYGLSAKHAQLLESCPEYRVRLKNLADKETALCGLTPGTEQYAKAYEAWQAKALAVADNLLQSDEVTSKAWIEARKYAASVLKTRPNFSVECNKMYADGSVFQNLMISILDNIENDMSCHVNHFNFLIAMCAAYDSFHFGFELHFNVLMAGKGSAGKSKMLEDLEHYHVNGTVQAASHRTAQAYNTNETHLDGCMAYGEAPHSDMCIDEYGKQKQADPQTKERMTSGIASTMEFARDPVTGERTTVYLHRIVMETLAMATNMSVDRLPEELRTRWVSVYVKDQLREDVSEGDSKNRSKSAIDAERVKRVREIWHLRHMLCIYAYKFISLGVLSDVKLDIGEMIIEDVERYLRSNHYLLSIHHRVKVQMLRYMRFLTILNAVHTVFNSEYGQYRKLRQAPWETAHIIAIEPFLYVTEEIAWFTVALFHEQILPVVQHRVLNAVAKMAGEAAPDVANLDDPLQLDRLAALAKEKELAEKETKKDALVRIADEVKRINDRVNKLRWYMEGDVRDFNYIEVSKPMRTVVDDIVNTMSDEAPSRVDIDQIIYKATSRSLLVPKRDRKTGKVIPGEFEKASAMKMGKSREHGDRPVIYICIEYLRAMNPAVIEEAIRSTFHQFTRERTHKVLLGKKARVPIGNGGKSIVAHSIYQTIEVKPNPEVIKKRHNPYALNTDTVDIDYKWIGKTNFVLSQMATASVVHINTDVESIVVADHMAEVGVNPNDRRTNLPPWFKVADMCAYEPKLEECIRNVRERCFKDEPVAYGYPQHHVRKLLRNVEEKHDLGKVPAHRVAAARSRYDAFAGKAWDDAMNFRSAHFETLRRLAAEQQRRPRIDPNPDKDNYDDNEEDDHSTSSSSSSSSSSVYNRKRALVPSTDSNQSILAAEDSVLF